MGQKGHSFIPQVRAKTVFARTVKDVSQMTRHAEVPTDIHYGRASQRSVMQESSIIETQVKSLKAEDTQTYLSGCYDTFDQDFRPDLA